MTTATANELTAQRGLDAWRRGDAAAARTAFETLARDGIASAPLLLMLAQARAATGADEHEVVEVLDRVLAREPRNVAALVMKGDRAGDDRAACSFYGLALSNVTEAHTRDPGMARLISGARASLAAASARFADHLRATVANVDAGSRFDEAIALVAGEKQLFLQQPTSFFFPGLPHRQFFDPAGFAWAPALTDAADAIGAELAGLLDSGEGGRPYVEADPNRASRGHALLNDPSWSAFHLLEGGAPHPINAARCPRTLAALADLPMPRIAGRSPMALFSVLRPGTHIPPHTGMLNTRLIVHLPLVVPPRCRLRVGNDTREVRAGELMIFDDSIEHEAWNDGDATRIVLLFEIWRPELSADERRALTRLFESIAIYKGGQ